MHLVDDEPNKQMDRLNAENRPRVGLGKAIYNKLRKAAGAPGRFVVDRITKPKLDLEHKTGNFLKDYNAKAKSGVAPISNKDRAIFQQIKDARTK